MVKAWKEDVIIPTYECGKFEKNPIFLEKRVYQGSSGVVYPYPVIESISNTKTDHLYHAVYLENEYIKVMILPELGGRVQMAYDKIKKRHFVYYNHVIKPALVGLAGPWISGGIEFNWPQHHRPSTFLPVDCVIDENKDGSVTVWVSEMERMFHQKGMAGFTLRPGCAYLEINGVLYNRTKMPQTFLWWANPAVFVNDYYQSVFPQDINAVFDHGKRDVSTFPIATGTYYKMDYSAGVDISNYKNIKVPTSYMGVNSKFDFEGGYENDTKGGMLHVANHHVSPGKKQWTWGNGDFGRAWDRNLTDDDGPYIELMAGVYTENQPDFSWIQPGEEKSFVQYFMPYRELGIVKNATRDIIMNIEQTNDETLNLKLLSTSLQDIIVTVNSDQGRLLFSKELSLKPEDIFDEIIDSAGLKLNDLNVVIKGKGNRVLLTWHAEDDEVKRVPDAAEAALYPEETKSIEQLYLTGLHLEQYRHATWSALDYYEEGLKRDPMDVRCNNAMGLWYNRKGRPDKAESYLRTAVKVLQKRNPNPYYGEPMYNLGISLKCLGRIDEAYDMFYKATWNGAWQNAAYYACAQISVMQGRLGDALYEVDRALVAGWHHHQARALKTAILREMGRHSEALDLIEESLKIDSFNYGCRYEKYLLLHNEDDIDIMNQMMHMNALNYHELALDYAGAGMWQECVDVLLLSEKIGAVNPMTYYYIGWAKTFQNKTDEAKEAFVKAEETDYRYCFPNRQEDIMALEKAQQINPSGAKAPYYLGCLYYDKRQYDVAVKAWESSLQADDSFPTVWRNLALAAFNKENDTKKAVEYMEKSFSLDTTDSRILMELDQLYKRMQYSHKKRLEFLEQYPALIAERDDLVLEEIILLNQTGKFDDAMKKLDGHIFHPWEGGEGKVSLQYQICRVELAKRAISEGHCKEAIKLLEECLVCPHNLGEGKLYSAQENDFYYLMGCAYEKMSDMDKARECWERATLGPTEPAAAMYYNDAKPDKIFYMGMAWRKLNDDKKANGTFYRLITYGQKHIFDTVKMDYFAVSLPDLLIWDGDLQLNNTIHCKYMMALGYYGMGNVDKCRKYLDEVEKLDANHSGISTFKTFIEQF